LRRGGAEHRSAVRQHGGIAGGLRAFDILQGADLYLYHFVQWRLQGTTTAAAKQASMIRKRRCWRARLRSVRHRLSTMMLV
jgi:hypothetical protein